MLPPVSESIAWITEHPAALVIFLFLLGALIYMALKKLLKLAFIFALGLVALFGYYAYTGEEPPDELKRIADDAGRKIEKGVKIGTEKAKEVGEKVGQEIEKAAKKGIDRALGGDDDKGN